MTQATQDLAPLLHASIAKASPGLSLVIPADQEAVDSIIHDYLTIGLRYPAKGWPYVTAGRFLTETLDEDDGEISEALDCLLFPYGDDERRERMEMKLTKLCEAGLPAWLRKKHAGLVERRMSELRADREEEHS